MTDKAIKLTDFLGNIKEKGFDRQDSIHSRESVRLAKELNFDRQVIEWMERGLSIDINIPEGATYEEKNNRSFYKYEEFFVPQLEEWLKEGKVEELDFKPDIINPLSIVEKIDGRTGKWKYRVVIDQSRFVNKVIECGKTKLDNLAMIEKAIEKDMYMTSFDLVSMYHQIRLTEETAEYFSFKYNDRQAGK